MMDSLDLSSGTADVDSGPGPGATGDSMDPAVHMMAEVPMEMSAVKIVPSPSMVPTTATAPSSAAKTSRSVAVLCQTAFASFCPLSVLQH